MWTQMDNVAEELRPDKCGIIFDRIGDSVISARIDEDHPMTDFILSQIESFGLEGFSVVVFRGASMQGHLHKSHTQDYVMDVIRGSS